MKVKVVTLNIYEGQLLDQAIAFINKEAPDILMLQEVYGENPADSPNMYRTLELLQKHLPLQHHFFSPGLRIRTSEGRFTSGNAIFSRFPIMQKDAVFFNAPYDDDYELSMTDNSQYPHVLQHVELDTPAGGVHAFNIHGSWDLDGDNYSEQRQQMSRAILDGVSGKSRVILAGDTNAKPTNQAIKEVETVLQSVFGTSLKTTFNMTRKTNPGYATAAVDMMFVSSDITIREKSCPQVDISDHLPLVTTVEI